MTIDRAAFDHEGFVFLAQALSQDSLAPLRKEAQAQLNAVQSAAHEDNVLIEDDDESVRLIRNIHQRSDVFAQCMRHPRLLSLAEGLLGGPVYAHNTKLNHKPPFTGGAFDWHQDYAYFAPEIPAPKMITLCLFLDDIGAHNAPMMLIPQSHQMGLINVPHRDEMTLEEKRSYPPSRRDNLMYSLPNEALHQASKKGGIYSGIGPAGSILAMSVNMFHASNMNLSPFSRRVFIVRYNLVSNAPKGEHPTALTHAF